MDINERKITEKDLEGKGIIGLPDVPGLSTEDMQRKLEEIPREVIVAKFNELIDWLLNYGATKEELQNIVINAGAVTGVFGRRGEVKAMKGDYTPEMVGASEEKHAAQHNKDGKDPLDVEGIGAAPNEHVHGNITRDGKIGAVNGKILITGIGGIVEAVEKENSGLVAKPAVIGDSGKISFTAEENKEYEYTGVTDLYMTGAKVNCRGVIKFADSIGDIQVTEFAGTVGDDIAEALPGETWEFDILDGRIIWANWGVI